MDLDVKKIVVKKPRDWVAAWFPIMEALGEDTRIPFGRYDPSTRTMEWLRIPHEEVDGVGGLTNLLAARNWKTGPLPRRTEPRPNWWNLAVSFVRYQPWVQPRSTAFLAYDYSKRGETCGIRWRVFEREETLKLRTQAERHGVSLNSFLLSALNTAATSLFLRPGSPTAFWWIPVNMRGAARKSDPASNHSSYLGVKLSAGMPAREVHHAIKLQLARRMHWGSWMGIHIGAFIGLRGMYWIMRQYEKKRNCWMGTFTNLGEWPPPGYEPPPEGDRCGWAVSSTVTVSHPIGAACLVWDGRLTLTLQIHPALTTDPEVVQVALDAWINQLNSADRSMPVRRGEGAFDRE